METIYINEYIKKEFLKFLKDNNIVKQYRDNCIRYSMQKENINIFECALYPMNVPQIYIDSIFFYSFNWSDTKESFYFWQNIHNSWKQLITSNLRKLLKKNS